MQERIARVKEWLNSRPLGSQLVALGCALVLLVAVSLVFKIKWMPRGERYIRGCLQDTASEALHIPQARKAARKGPAVLPWLYGAIPWRSYKTKPKNEWMGEVYEFCRELYGKEANTNSLRTLINDGHMNYLDYPMQLAVKVRERVSNGWVVGGDRDEQLKMLNENIDNWKESGHNFDIQGLLKKYDEYANSDTQRAVSKRLFEVSGEFHLNDICRNKDLFERRDIVDTPNEFYSIIKCK